jgi:gliding motility-associated-like protein
MKKQVFKNWGIFLLLLCFTHLSIAQRGKDGPRTITALNTVVNEYTILTANASAGSTGITVNNSGLNLNSRFPGALSAGDLLLIIQLQGAELFFGAVFPDGNGNSIGYPKDSTWGAVLNYHNCGNYELAEVIAIPNATNITLSCGLKNNYTSAGKVLIVRVPRYTDLTVNAGASLTCDTWNGTIGGVLAIEVDEETVVNGSINVNGRGFRGGVLDNQAGFGSNDVSTDNATFGAEKGEGIAGFQNDYNIAGGRYCKGAPANGGGGGNMHNGGGGGGGNGGDPLLWRAVGNPSNANAGWTTAWNLEFAGLSSITSTGGGRGGYTASNNNQNALTTRPGNSAWGGDNRSPQGGFGGRPLDYSSGKVFMAGGGGAGDSNNGFGGAGGRGGGLIYLVQYAAMTGSGSITANGADGANSSGTPSFNGIAGQDAAGGGGAGGTILISNTSGISGVQLAANGGLGGNQDLSRGVLGPNPINESQGPGGGGGGGYINCSFPITATVLGGANGTTDSDALTEFPPNGATFGGAGESLSNFPAYDFDVEDDSVCVGGSVTINASIIGTAPPGVTLEWYDAPVNGNLLFTGSSFTTPLLNSTTSYFVGSCPGHFRKEVEITVTPPVSASVAGPNQIQCVGSAALAGNFPLVGNGTWTLVSGTANIIDPSSAVSLVDLTTPGIVVFEWTISSPGCPSTSDQVSITVQEPPSIADAGPDQIICFNNTVMNAVAPTVGTGQWSLQSGIATITDPNLPNTTVTGVGAAGAVLVWTTANGVCPNAVDPLQITISAGVTAAIAGSDQTVCTGTFALSGNVPSNGAGTWSLISGNASIVDPTLANSDVVLNTPGTVVLDWTISLAGCPSSSDQIILTVVQPPDVANAGPDQSTCNAAVVLAANIPVVGTGAWTIISGSATLADPNDAQSALSSIAGSSVTLVWSTTNSICPASTDTIVVFSNPSISIADAGGDQTVCSDTLALAAVAPTSGTGTWNLISGTANILNPNLFNSDIVLNTPGTVTLEWTVSASGCPSSSDQVVYTVQPSPTTSNAGIDQGICGSSTQLAGNTALVGTGVWTLVSGAGTILDVNDPLTNISGLGQGANQLSWTIDNGICPPSVSLVTIDVSLPTGPSVAGPDQVVCGTQTQLAGNLSLAGSGQWTIVSGNGNIVNANDPLSIINNLQPGVIVLQWTLQNGICPPETDQVQITVNAPLPAADAGSDQSICGSVATLSSILPVSLTGTWTVVSGNGTLVDPNNPGTDIQFTQEGTTVLSWSISDGVCPPVSDQVTIIHVNPPVAPSAGADAVTCASSYTLQASSVDAGVWTIISGTGIIDVAALPSANLSASPGSVVVCRWTVGQAPCAPIFDEVTIRFGGGGLVADAGPDLTIKAGGQIALQSNASGNIQWSPSAGLSCADCAIPTANPLQSTTYYLTVSDADGCTISDSVFIKVDAIISMFIPTGFSPNSDGNNDIFRVLGLGINSVRLSIYDRMGENVSTLTEPAASWDGTFRGKKCNPGVYYYYGEIGTVDGKVESVQGEVTLTY